MKIVSEPVCVAPAGDRCGEGPVWHAAAQALYWTDINRFLIHRFDPCSKSLNSWFFDEPVTALALTDRDDVLAVVLGSRLILWTPEIDERRDHGFRLPGWPAVRSNDARPDPRGSLWLGSMRNNIDPDGSPRACGGKDGALYCIDSDGSVTERKRGIGVSNTLAWSPDRTRFYFADTLENAIFVYDYDATNGAISGERPFFAGFSRGWPDGSTVDNEGYLWNCRYGGSCVVRVAPNGDIDRVIEMPVLNLTSCTFGGPELRTLYVTSAGLDAPPSDRMGGGVFSIQTDVPGLPENRFAVFGGRR